VPRIPLGAALDLLRLERLLPPGGAAQEASSDAARIIFGDSIGHQGKGPDRSAGEHLPSGSLFAEVRRRAREHADVLTAVVRIGDRCALIPDPV